MEKRKEQFLRGDKREQFTIEEYQVRPKKFLMEEGNGSCVPASGAYAVLICPQS